MPAMSSIYGLEPLHATWSSANCGKEELNRSSITGRIHLHKYFRDTGGYKEGDFPIAEELGDSTLSVPFYPTMPLEHIHTVCSALEEIMPA